MKRQSHVLSLICLLHTFCLSTLAQQGCIPTADVVFLLDGSDSISNAEFQQQRDLMSIFVNNSNIGPDGTRVGFAVVSTTVGEQFPLYGSLNKGVVQAAINNLTQPQEGSRTDLGLVQMEQMFGSQGRPGVLRVGVIMTDGRAKFEQATEMEASVVKNSGIFLIAIGVGRLIKFKELEKIASTANNAFSVEPIGMSSKILMDTIDLMGGESCAGQSAAILDTVQAGNNPNVQQMADMALKMLSNGVRQDAGLTGPGNMNGPMGDLNGMLLANPNAAAGIPNGMPLENLGALLGGPNSLQLNIDGMNNPEKHMYDILNASLPQLQSLMQDITGGTAMNQIPLTTTPGIPTAPLPNLNSPRANGLKIAFNGGVIDQNPLNQVTQPMNQINPMNAMNPAGPDNMADVGLNTGSPMVLSEPLIQVPVMKETLGTNMLTKTPVGQHMDMRAQPDVTVMDAPQDQCSKGRYVNGIGHTFVPNSCTQFLQCMRDNGKVQVETARCPFETFYDDKSAVCRYYEDAPCWRDPCSGRNADSYSHPGNCRAYWSCTTGSSVPMCCPLGSSFSPGIGCINNATCQDNCMDFGSIKSVITKTKCRMLPMETNDKFFFERVSGLGWLVRSCPPGSRFNPNLCNCNKPDVIFKPSCRPELYLTFEEGVFDSSGNHLAMGNKNVRADTGSGIFDGNSHLTLWRFSGVSFGQKVKITFRFRTSVWAPKGRLMHIVSNCCLGCGTMPQPSINIAIIPGHNGGIAVFSSSTTTTGENFIYVHYEDAFTGWNRLTYTYDGNTLTGTVNTATESKNTIGDIQSRPYPLMIGACGQTGAYRGQIDDFEFYMCTAH